MKKLLTLFTLLLTVCSGAWGKMAVMDFCKSTRSYSTMYTVNNMYSDGSGNGIYIGAGGSTISVTENSSKTINDCSFSGYSSSNKNIYYFAMAPTSGESISKITFYFERQSNCTTATFVRKDGQAMTVDPIITLSDFDSNNPKQDSVVVVGEFVQGVAYTLTLKNGSSNSNQRFYGARVEYGTTPTATFSNGNYTIGGSTLALSSLWESNAPGAVAYSVKDANGTGASISDGAFSATTAGTATVYAIQAAAGAYAGAIKTATITVVEGVIIPTLTGAWKIGDAVVTSANVIQGGSVTIPTFTVGATSSGTPTGSDYNVAYELKEGSTSGIFEFTDGVPTGISAATAGTATVTATLTTKDASKYLTPATNTFEYTVTVNAPAAPTFSPDASAVVYGTEITMTSPDGGEIWYTTSGDDPTESNKTVYDAEAKPTITDATTIKAIARVNGYSSAVTTANYTVAVVGTKTWDFTDEVSAADLANLTADDTNWLAPSGSELRWKNKVEFSAGEAKANGKTLQEFEGLSFCTISADNFRWMPGDGTGNGFLQMNGNNYNFTISGLKVGDVVTMSYQGAGSGERSMSSDSNASLTSGTNSNVSDQTIVNPSWTVSTAGNVKFTQTKGLKIYSVNVQRAGVETVDVTVTPANYKAYNTTMATDFTMTDGVQAFIVSEATAETIKLEEIQMAPANTPVILKTAGDYTLYEAIVTPAAISGNKLQISNGTVSGDGSTKFALGKKNDVAGFYLVGNGVTIPTSYVEIIGGTAKDFIPFMNEGSETDGINAVTTAVDNGEAYNLAGQRVGKDYKGIVIVNGKKVIRK